MLTSSRSEDRHVSAAFPAPAKVLIGRVSSAHGLRGEINVIPLTDFPERFQEMESISLYKEGRLLRRVKVLGIRSAGETLILRTDLGDRDAAEACVGTSILIDPSERVDLPPDSFWIDDLVGLKVVDDVEGRALGVVTNFLAAGANELYEVRDPAGKLHYIPAVSEFIRRIDVENGTLHVRLIEGLWE